MKISGPGSSSFLRNANQLNNNINKRFNRLASGTFSNRDRPAQKAQAQNLIASITESKSNVSNISRTSAALRTAEGGLSSIVGDLQRLRELAVQSANGTLGAQDRQNLQTEFGELQKQIDQVSSTTSFGDVNLLDGSFEDIQSASTNGLGIAGEGVATQEGAADAIAAIDSALNEATSSLARLGAQQNALEFRESNELTTQVNLEAARSQAEDIDLAEEISGLQAEQVRQKFLIQAQSASQQSAKDTTSLLTKTLGANKK